MCYETTINLIILILYLSGLEIPVLNVQVRGDSIYIRWTTVLEATEYTLVIEEKTGQQPNQPPKVRAVEVDFYTETDIKPWTTYCMRLAAKNTMSQSDFSKPICLTTGAS